AVDVSLKSDAGRSSIVNRHLGRFLFTRVIWREFGLDGVQARFQAPDFEVALFVGSHCNDSLILTPDIYLYVRKRSGAAGTQIRPDPSGEVAARSNRRQISQELQVYAGISVVDRRRSCADAAVERFRIIFAGVGI